MDEFTKRKVKRAMKQNPDLPIKIIIKAIRAMQSKYVTTYVKSNART